MWTNRLRQILRLNAATSLIGGLVATVAAGWVSKTLGIDHVTLTRVVGIGLIVFAADVGYASTRPAPKLFAETAMISAGDAMWVTATIVVVAAGWLNGTGTLVAVLLGVMVADFAAAQLWARSKARAEQPTAAPVPIAA